VLLGFVSRKVDGNPIRALKEKDHTVSSGLKDTYAGTGKTDVSKKESFSYSTPVTGNSTKKWI
jgi:hypothetical protein